MLDAPAAATPPSAATRSSPPNPADGAALREALEARALAFSLAGRLAAYPDEGLAARLGPVLEALAGDGPPSLVAVATRFATEGRGPGLVELQSNYLALFDAGSSRCPVHETEYGRMRGMSKGTELADIAGFYRAFGVDLSEAEGDREMHDHLAVELEFYGVLLAKRSHLGGLADVEGCAVVDDARRKFLVDHLGRLAPAVAGQPTIAGAGPWADVFRACAELVADECLTLGVTPAPLDFHAAGSQADGEALCCGAVELPRPAAGGPMPTRPLGPAAGP